MAPSAGLAIVTVGSVLSTGVSAAGMIATPSGLAKPPMVVVTVFVAMSITDTVPRSSW